jgi:hypothetical protein
MILGFRVRRIFSNHLCRYKVFVEIRNHAMLLTQSATLYTNGAGTLKLQVFVNSGINLGVR